MQNRDLAAIVVPEVSMAKDYLTTREAAQMLGLTDSRIRQLLIAGTLKGKRFGHIWMIERRAIQNFAKNRSKSEAKPLDKD